MNVIVRLFSRHYIRLCGPCQELGSMRKRTGCSDNLHGELSFYGENYGLPWRRAWGSEDSLLLGWPPHRRMTSCVFLSVFCLFIRWPLLTTVIKYLKYSFHAHSARYINTSVIFKCICTEPVLSKKWSPFYLQIFLLIYEIPAFFSEIIPSVVFSWLNWSNNFLLF